MKKLLTLFACISLGGAAIAQPAAGDLLIKGEIGFKTLGSTPYKSMETGAATSSSGAVYFLSFTPRLEYFVSDRMSIGLTGGYISGWNHSKDTWNDKYWKLTSGVYAYYAGMTYNYYIKLAQRFYLSVNCSLGYAGGKVSSVYKTTDGLDDYKDMGGCAGFGLLTVTPTLNYFINEHWLFTASVGSLAGAYGKLKGSDTNIYYAGADWGNIMLGVGFRF